MQESEQEGTRAQVPVPSLGPGPRPLLPSPWRRRSPCLRECLRQPPSGFRGPVPARQEHREQPGVPAAPPVQWPHKGVQPPSSHLASCPVGPAWPKGGRAPASVGPSSDPHLRPWRVTCPVLPKPQLPHPNLQHRPAGSNLRGCGCPHRL